MGFTHWLKFRLNRWTYPIVKAILFQIDAENVHTFFLRCGERLGRKKWTRGLTRWLFSYRADSLKQEVAGVSFANPIGLAAGFDYNAQLTEISPSVGFGYHVVGSVTLGSYPGNATPRLGRLPKSKSLLVNKGLKSEGALAVSKKMKSQHFSAPVWVSIAKTNSKKTAKDSDAIADYVRSLEIFEKVELGDVYEINISCPNAFGGEAFTTPKKLDRLLAALGKTGVSKPMFLKMPINLTEKETHALCEVALKHAITGLVFGNLEKDRSNPDLHPKEIARATKGNFSGKPTEKKSNALLESVYRTYGNKFVLVGCGGIFTAEDAYKKIKLGATLLQMITGMIYRGPGTIGDINYEMHKLLKRDGYSHISEVIGTGVKK